MVRALWNRFTTRVPFTLPWLRWISLHLFPDDKWRPQLCLPNHGQVGMELIQPMQMDVQFLQAMQMDSRFMLLLRRSCRCHTLRRSTRGFVRCIVSISAVCYVPRYICCEPRRLRCHPWCYAIMPNPPPSPVPTPSAGGGLRAVRGWGRVGVT